MWLLIIPTIYCIYAIHPYIATSLTNIIIHLTVNIQFNQNVDNID